MLGGVPARVPELAPVPMSQSATTLSRLMQPDEANVYGNVHGGSILKYIDEAAAVDVAVDVGFVGLHEAT